MVRSIFLSLTHSENGLGQSRSARAGPRPRDRKVRLCPNREQSVTRVNAPRTDIRSLIGDNIGDVYPLTLYVNVACRDLNDA